MSDNDQSNNKQAPTIFYAKKSKNDYPKSSKGKPNTGKAKHYGRDDKSSRPYASRSEDDSRIETFKPRNKKVVQKENDSPWKNRFQQTEQLPTTFIEDEKPAIDYDQLKRQRKEETLVYSENSCKALFLHRREAIVKAFLVKEKTYEFKELIAYLVEQRLGYDVVSEEQLQKIAQTQHHGGICLITKKREAQSVGNYLLSSDLKKDAILAIDDVNNPHNLGGIARTAAFFNINGLMLRSIDALESGAAMRVSEGGTEAVSLIKAEDFIASIDQFKLQNYQIVMILPNKIDQLKAQKLDKSVLPKKTVFVIAQKVNPALINIADQLVYLPASSNMSALNISVLTGVVLAKWQAQNSE